MYTKTHCKVIQNRNEMYILLFNVKGQHTTFKNDSAHKYLQMKQMYQNYSLSDTQLLSIYCIYVLSNTNFHSFALKF